MSDELKACPFCGGNGLVVIDRHDSTAQVMCRECFASTDDDLLNDAHATAAWNRRVVTREQVDSAEVYIRAHSCGVLPKGAGLAVLRAAGFEVAE